MTAPTETPDDHENGQEPAQDWVTTDELAYLWSFHPSTLQRWRRTGTGPPWFRIGRRVYYERTQLAQYLDECTQPVG